ncbi:hypothetical protein [Enterobacteriaceae endosymbiont of Macroplea appendiculata]|uniref:hypothetical protein n=1 Tax=Enterobacteriaceae endosymbiont of Macroplea appendiculata TaxID=2675790 RepID=UPI001449D026|nr:hypothetical protein [Enterobacteriaceae endosymbiont of Macroplea appendiculata]QJC30807.1 hypothetical protein GJT86_00955 [Enterobacteriaceae endosymbiont of Macroplea appendiculata]
MISNTNKYAFISVVNKSHLLTLVKILIQYKYNIIANPKTYLFLKSQGYPVINLVNYLQDNNSISNVNLLSNNKIYHGISSNRSIQDITLFKQNNIYFIDLVVINIYDFYIYDNDQVINVENSINNIDNITSYLLLSAAKNYKYVTSIIDPIDYDFIISELQSNCFISVNTKIQLANKTFDYVYLYIKKLSTFFNTHRDYLLYKNVNTDVSKYNINKFSSQQKDNIQYESSDYHQKQFLNNIEEYLKQSNLQQIQGKELLYIDYITIKIILDYFNIFIQPTCIIFQNTQLCSVASNIILVQAYINAYCANNVLIQNDMIIGLNQPLNIDTVTHLVQHTHIKIILVPDITYKARQMLSKKNIIVLIYKLSKNSKKINIQYINQDYFVNKSNDYIFQQKNINIVSLRQPTQQEMKDMFFCWKIIKLIKTNSIICSKNNITLGIGNSKIDLFHAIKIAIKNAKINGFNTKNSCIASEAFITSEKCIHYMAKYGITCIIQPGGAIHDKMIISVANKYNISMIFTNIRYIS